MWEQNWGASRKNLKINFHNSIHKTMNENELKSLWQSANEKLERSLQVSQKNTDEIMRLKAQNVLGSMKPIKIFTLFVGIIWVLFGGTIVTNLFVYAYDKVSLFFLYSAAVQLLLTALAIGIYLYQLIMISNVNISDSVITAQKKLSYLKSSTLWSAKILFLQLPFWTTFYLSKEMIVSGNIAYILINGFFTLLFAYLAIWLFFNIKYENRNKKWFQWIFRGREWQPILQAMEWLNQIDNYQQQDEKTPAANS
jgi:hypothetical protein